VLIDAYKNGRLQAVDTQTLSHEQRAKLVHSGNIVIQFGSYYVDGHPWGDI